jgi:hypothetical protein
MSTAPEQVLSLMAAAAELRAAGASWEAVAAKLGPNECTFRRWEKRYAAQWDRLFHAAEVRLTKLMGGEARSVLRALLRHKDRWVRLHAGRFLLSHRWAAPLDPPADAAQPSAESLRIAMALDEMPEEQIQSLLDEEVERKAEQLLAERAAARLPAPPAHEGPDEPPNGAGAAV